jgi:phosphatidylinositol glycan class B
LAVALVVRNKSSYQSYLILGCLLGFSFLFRFQIAFAALGLVFWLIFRKKEAKSKIAAMMASGIAIVAFGILIDSWFYGDWVLTFVNYFRAYLIGQKTAEFGALPWFYFIDKIFNSLFPVGFLVLISFLFLLFKKYDSVFIWTVLPFLFFHSFIYHKELRFLFPVINFVPVIIFLAIKEVPPVKWINPPGKIIKGLLILILIVNLLGVIVASIIPAGDGRIRIAQEIHEINTKKMITIYFADNSNPFSPWWLTTNFYTPQNAKYKKIDFSRKNDIPKIDDNVRNIIVVSMKDLQNREIQSFITGLNMKEQCKSVPEFLIPLLKISNIYRTKDILVMYSD